MRRSSSVSFLLTAVAATLCSQAALARTVYTLDGRQCSRQEYHGAELAEQGHKFMDAGRFNEAADRLRKAASLAPRLGYVQSNLAFVLVKLGRAEEALPYLKNAVKINKGAADSVRALSSAYVSCGKLADAVQLLEDFQQRRPGDGACAEMKTYCTELRKELVAQSKAVVANGGAVENYLAFATAEDGTVRWQFDRLPLKVYAAPGTGVAGFKPEFASEMEQAFRSWEEVSDGRIRFRTVSSSTEADITLTWTDNVKDLDSPDEGGEARVKFGTKGIVHSDIFVLTHNNITGREHTSNQIYGVCLHEIGHSLGLLNHSPDAHDVMFFSDRNADLRPELTRRDRNTINLLYQTAQAYLPKQGSTEAFVLNRSELFNSAVDDYNGGRFEDAIKKCEGVIKIDPTFAKATRLLADSLDNQCATLIEKRDFERAEVFGRRAYDTRRAMGSGADLSDTVYNYAIVLRALHKDEEAQRIEAEVASTKISQK